MLSRRGNSGVTAASNPAQVTAKATILQYNYVFGVATDFRVRFRSESVVRPPTVRSATGYLPRFNGGGFVQPAHSAIGFADLSAAQARGERSRSAGEARRAVGSDQGPSRCRASMS